MASRLRHHAPAGLDVKEVEATTSRIELHTTAWEQRVVSN